MHVLHTFEPTHFKMFHVAISLVSSHPHIFWSQAVVADTVTNIINIVVLFGA